MTNVHVVYRGEVSNDPDKGWLPVSSSLYCETAKEAQTILERLFDNFPIYMRVVKVAEMVVWGEIPKGE